MSEGELVLSFCDYEIVLHGINLRAVERPPRTPTGASLGTPCGLRPAPDAQQAPGVHLQNRAAGVGLPERSSQLLIPRLGIGRKRK